MLYFHLDYSIFSGEESEIGDIQSYFFNKVFSSLSDAHVLINVWSEDPQFSSVEQLKGKKWALIAVDDERTDTTRDELLDLMKKAHSISIPTFDKSLNDLNLRYDFIVHIPNDEVETSYRDWLAEENLSYITETVCDTNMTLNDKITTIGDELIKVGSEGNTLIIVDRFIFPKKHDADYKDLFCGIVDYSKASRLTIVTDSGTENPAILTDIQNKLHIPMQIKHQKNLHDRWWIVEEEKKGLLFGTSLNGLGKDKLSTISPSLVQTDILKILKNI